MCKFKFKVSWISLLLGPVDPSNCSILEGVTMLVLQRGIYNPLTVEAKDKFGNICPISDQDIQSYRVSVSEVGVSLLTEGC